MKKPYRLRQRGKGKNWEYKLADDRCFHSTGIASKRKAEEFAAQKAAIRMTELNMGFDHTLTFGQYTLDFFEWGKCPWIQESNEKGKSTSPDTAKWRRGLLKNYLVPKFGETPICEIRAKHVNQYIKNLELSPSTKNSLLSTASIIFDMAVMDEVVGTNPIKSIRPFKKTTNERGIFTKDELDRMFPDDKNLFESIWGSIEMGLFMMTLAYSGMRVGEVRVLNWDDLNFKDGIIEVTKSLSNSGIVKQNTKNGESRISYMPEKLAERLRLWLNRSTGLVFPLLMKGPTERGTYMRAFSTAMEYLGIAKKERNLVVHSFRHTYNTLLRLALKNDDILRDFTGHKSPSMTEVYFHQSKDQMIEKLLENTKIVETVFA